MTSQTETTDFDMNLVDLLQKTFSEEKKAHGETILQLLSAQAQAQTAEAEAAKAQELVAETTMKLDQAREEIKGLRAQTQDAQIQAQEAQTKIKDLEGQVAQMRLSEQSQAQNAIEAQEEVRSLRAQAQELETARSKIASLESRMVKARAFFAEVEVETNSEPIDQTQELKAKIESLETQLAQIKLFEQFQAQSQELSVAHATITELEAEIAQSKELVQEEIVLLKSEIQDQKAQAQELLGAQAQAQEAQTKITDLEAQIAQMRLSEQSQAQNAVEAQEEVRNLTFQVQYDRVKGRKIDTANAFGRETRAQVLQETYAMLTGLEDQVPKPSSVQVSQLSEWYSPSWQSCDQIFRIEQNDCRVWFKSPGSPNTHLFCKFVREETVILSSAPFRTRLTCWFRVSVSDGQCWTTIGHLGPENPKMPIWKWMLRRAPSRINADGKKEYKLVICCERLPNVSSY